MSVANKKEKWIVKDKEGVRQGVEIYESKEKAQGEITKLCESKDTLKESELKAVQLLTE